MDFFLRNIKNHKYVSYHEIFCFTDIPTKLTFLCKTHRGDFFVQKNGVTILDNFKIVYEEENKVRLVNNDSSELNIEGETLFFLEKYSLKKRIGGIHWGSKPITNKVDHLEEGANIVKFLGLSSIKIYIGHKSDITYNTNYKNIYPKDIINQNNYQKLLQMNWEKVVLVYNGTDNYGSWKKSCEKTFENIINENAKVIYDLAKELGKYPRTKFIITNWEGDCMINKDKNKDTYNKFLLWVKARQEGVSKARKDFNIDNVFHGIEVNFVRQSLFNHPSVLTEVVPFVNTDYLSYSCYDCRNNIEFEENLNLIKKLCNRPIIIGEFGSGVQISTIEETQSYFFGMLEVIEKYEIELAMYWRVLDKNYDKRGFGLVNHENEISSIFLNIFNL
jgi:hypothetical protein